jgi:hypothetical protein
MIGSNKVHWLNIGLTLLVICIASFIVYFNLKKSLANEMRLLELKVLRKNENRLAAV